MIYSITSDIHSSIFHAYDIRGIVGEHLSANIVYTLGLTLGTEIQKLNETHMVVARDGRLSSPELCEALSAGLLASGCHVVDIGLVATPVLYFATHNLPYHSGVMLTGSHNAANYNGLKIVLAGETLAGDAIQKIYQLSLKQDFIYGQGKYEIFNIIPNYLAAIKKNVLLKRPLKIVVDCGSGATSHIAPQLFRLLGCDVVELFCQLDGHFPHHHPDPSMPENMKDLINRVTLEKADLGLAFDGDGDRLGVVSNSGEIIWPDRLLMLFARDVISRHPHGLIIFDVKCSNLLAKVIKADGAEPLMWKTGHSYIKAKLRETGAILAGEMSGHFFFKENWYGFDDGMYAGARFLQIIARHGKSVDEIFKTFPNGINTPEIRLPIDNYYKFELMKMLKLKAKFENAHLNFIDGIRVEFIDGWGLVRPSNTSPFLIFRFEANNRENLARIQQLFREQLLAVDKNLQLPF
ncbi:MAG: phosphomannomutase/phosphoglucomutase [Gammaproteobacteria bacterium]|nr:phosphomannomutase/phosphoglucomutase [Gammaproteobacteria bacterium]